MPLDTTKIGPVGDYGHLLWQILVIFKRTLASKMSNVTVDVQWQQNDKMTLLLGLICEIVFNRYVCLHCKQLDAITETFPHRLYVDVFWSAAYMLDVRTGCRHNSSTSIWAVGMGKETMPGFFPGVLSLQILILLKICWAKLTGVWDSCHVSSARCRV